MKNNYSKNKKLNEVLSRIERQLLELGLDEVKHYKKSFPNEIDYNIAQYGSVLVFYSDVKQMYKDCGYKSLEKMSDEKVWEIYKRQVGYVARELTK